ncbi:MAG: protease complex subunit PrcB family protein [Flavobacteriales bacterium]|nr:protease complex subunit PrcB family protein [Flavobacteriales bacterium]
MVSCKNLIFSGLVILSIGVLASCISIKVEKDSPKELKFRSISKNNLSGIIEPLRIVIQDEEAYNKIWSSIWSHYSETVEKPKINFDEETLILVASGMKNNSGYHVEISQVLSQKNGIVVKIKETTPNSKCNYSQVVTYPYELISIKKNSGKYTFISESVVGDCK